MAAAQKVKSIYSDSLFNHTPLASINVTRDRIGLDIGGTLTKIVYTLNNRVYCEKFSTESIEEILEFLERLIEFKELKCDYVVTTGGGSYKFYDRLHRVFTIKNGIKVIKKDEMESLIYGLDFLIKDISNEVFIMDHETEKINYLEKIEVKYPYLLVNIGSGVSILKIKGPNCEFERIGGSSLGGGSLWGLLSILTSCEDYDSMLTLSESGNNNNIDMLVGDIYGCDYNNMGLKSSTIASTFGKVFKKNIKNESFEEADMAKSLIYSISNNIGQISYLHAKINDVENIFFGGSYISNHKFIIKTLSYAINFWSKGEMQAHFLKHDGFIGAIGTFLNSSDGKVYANDRDSEDINRKLFKEKLDVEYRD